MFDVFKIVTLTSDSPIHSYSELSVSAGLFAEQLISSSYMEPGTLLCPFVLFNSDCMIHIIHL